MASLDLSLTGEACALARGQPPRAAAGGDAGGCEDAPGAGDGGEAGAAGAGMEEEPPGATAPGDACPGVVTKPRRFMPA